MLHNICLSAVAMSGERTVARGPLVTKLSAFTFIKYSAHYYEGELGLVTSVSI